MLTWNALLQSLFQNLMKQMEMFPFSLDELQTEQSKVQIICPWVISGGKRVKLKGRCSWKYGVGLGGGGGQVQSWSMWLPLLVPVCLQHVRAGCLGQQPVWEWVFSAHDTWGHREPWDRELYSRSLSLPVTTLQVRTLFLQFVKALMLFIGGVDWCC